MKFNMKLLALLLVGLSSFVTVIAASAGHYLLPTVSPSSVSGYPQLGDVTNHIEKYGVTPGLQAVLRATATRIGTRGLYVAEEESNADPPHRAAQGPVLAAYPEVLVGLAPDGAEPLIAVQTRELPFLGSGMTAGVQSAVAGPDGRHYLIYMITTFTRPGLTTALLAALVAWLALAAWVYLDARDLASPSAVGWLLLTVSTGPVALPIWIIYRRTIGLVPSCPGCRAQLVKGTVFCVHCGHALCPTCPECNKPVQVDWTYCGACGTNLSQNSSTHGRISIGEDQTVGHP